MEVIISSGEGWQRALSWMTWEGYMRQKMDEEMSKWVNEGGWGSRILTIYQCWFDSVLLWASSDQTEMGDRRSVRQSRELKKLSAKTPCYTQKYGWYSPQATVLCKYSHTLTYSYDIVHSDTGGQREFIKSISHNVICNKLIWLLLHSLKAPFSPWGIFSTWSSLLLTLQTVLSPLASNYKPHTMSQQNQFWPWHAAADAPFWEMLSVIGHQNHLTLTLYYSWIEIS